MGSQLIAFILKSIVEGLLLKSCIGEEVRVEAGIFSEEHVEIKRFL
ncbi:hypothetical protein [Candidatus Coxiella mudrowiae]|nr:hypothetical protein [Candidatus Coxiella mudrowiae]